MRALKIVLIATTILLAVSGATEASVLVTTPLFTGSSNFLNCSVFNVGSTTREVAVELINGAGAVIVSNSGPLDPSHVIAAPTGPTAATLYCRVTVDGPKSAVRGALLLSDSAGSIILFAPVE